MALVSPGVQITVTDESQYASSAIGTTPLVILATAQTKTINGKPENAGKNIVADAKLSTTYQRKKRNQLSITHLLQFTQAL